MKYALIKMDGAGWNSKPAKVVAIRDTAEEAQDAANLPDWAYWVGGVPITAGTMISFDPLYRVVPYEEEDIK